MVAELGEGNPISSKASGDSLAIQHAVDAEVLADVAQERDDVDVLRPVEVVDQLRSRGPLEVEEVGKLSPQARYPLVHDIDGIERALPRHLGIADEPRRASDKR